MPSIAKSHPQDAPALTAIAHEAKRSWGYPEAWIRAWRDDLTLDQAYIESNLVFALRDQDRLLGFYSLIPLDSIEGRWELDNLWLVTATRGQGLGRALFEHAVNQARVAGARRLRILSDPHAEAFYHRMGAQTVGRLDASIGGVERWLPEMELVLEDHHGPGSPERP
jgi:GNAT superfamily N-acetyltransferase